MENKMIDGVKVAVNYAQASDAPVSDDEIKAYIKRAYDKYPHGQLESLTLDVDGEDVGIHYGLAPREVRPHPPHHRLPGGHARPLQRRQARRGARPRQARGSRLLQVTWLFQPIKKGRCEMLFATALLFRSLKAYSGNRPSRARPKVTSSANSKSPPTGSPLAGRVTFTPKGLMSRAR